MHMACYVRTFIVRKLHDNQTICLDLCVHVAMCISVVLLQAAVPIHVGRFEGGKSPQTYLLPPILLRYTNILQRRFSQIIFIIFAL